MNGSGSIDVKKVLNMNNNKQKIQLIYIFKKNMYRL